MLAALIIMLIRQYRLVGNRQEFFKWMFQKIRLYTFKALRMGMTFFIIAVL